MMAAAGMAPRPAARGDRKTMALDTVRQQRSTPWRHRRSPCDWLRVLSV